jgi:hypothetical protein
MVKNAVTAKGINANATTRKYVTTNCLRSVFIIGTLKLIDA